MSRDKVIWMRIGMSVRVSEKKFQDLLDRSLDENGIYQDVELTHAETKEFLKTGWQDGESYIPCGVIQDIAEGDG